mmetsp:Transcript_95093/g.116432  ORF Transcript_95093/g.116432 Transcript_95093/m.116432 type:complete len:101 (-) Transcript_95093:101-403(-)
MTDGSEVSNTTALSMETFKVDKTPEYKNTSMFIIVFGISFLCCVGIIIKLYMQYKINKSYDETKSHSDIIKNKSIKYKCDINSNEGNAHIQLKDGTSMTV